MAEIAKVIGFIRNPRTDDIEQIYVYKDCRVNTLGKEEFKQFLKGAASRFGPDCVQGARLTRDGKLLLTVPGCDASSNEETLLCYRNRIKHLEDEIKALENIAKLRAYDIKKLEDELRKERTKDINQNNINKAKPLALKAIL